MFSHIFCIKRCLDSPDSVMWPCRPFHILESMSADSSLRHHRCESRVARRFLALPVMTSRNLLVLMAKSFLTTSSAILFTTGLPAHNWSLISCAFWVRECDTLLGPESKAKDSPKFETPRRVAIVMARLVALVFGLNLASPILDPEIEKLPGRPDSTCLLTY